MFRIRIVLPLRPQNGCNEKRTNIQIRYLWRFHRFWNLLEENDDRELSRCYFGETFERRCFGRIRASESHWGTDRSWYQQSCGQKKQIGIVDKIAAKLETLVKKFQEAGIPLTIVKISGGVGHKEKVKQLNRKYENVAKRTRAHFHTPERFTVGGSGEKGDLTGGLHTDGLHPNPEYLQRYSEDLYDALKPLF